MSNGLGSVSAGLYTSLYIAYDDVLSEEIYEFSLFKSWFLPLLVTVLILP